MIHAIGNLPFTGIDRALQTGSRTPGDFGRVLRSAVQTDPGGAADQSSVARIATPFDLTQIPQPGQLRIPNPNPNPLDSAAVMANLNAANQYYEGLQNYHDEYNYESTYNQWLTATQNGTETDSPAAPTHENTSAAFLGRLCGAASLIQNSGKGPGNLDADTALQELANGGGVMISCMGKIFKPQAGGPELDAKAVIAALSPGSSV